MRRARRAWIMDGHDLIELRRGIGIERNRRGRRHTIGAAAHVDDDDLVAEAIHLQKMRGFGVAHATASERVSHSSGKTPSPSSIQGPVIKMWSSPTRHSMVSGPPGN